MTKTRQIDLGVWERVRFLPKINYVSDDDHNGAAGMALAQKAYEELQRQQLEELIEKQDRQKYKDFLRRAGNLRDASMMKSALIRHFSDRFGRDGVQSLVDYDDERVVGVYYGVIDYARKLIEKFDKS